MKSIFTTLVAGKVPDVDFASVHNAHVAGMAQSSCLRTQSMEADDLRVVPCRQCYRFTTHECQSSPRLLFCDLWARCWVHWHAASHAALDRLVMGWLNLPRSHVSHRVFMNELVFTLTSSGLLLCPFTDPLPPLTPFAAALSNTLAGRWLMSIRSVD